MTKAIDYNLLTQEELNEIFSYETIVRSPWEQPLGAVPMPYHRNMAELKDFISESFDRNSMNSTLDIILDNQGDFNDWILECHRVACVGKDNNRIYKGRSESSPGFDIRDHAGNFRRMNDRVKFYLKKNVSSTEMVYAVAKHFEDPLVQGSFDIDDWVKKHQRQSLLRYQTGNLPIGKTPRIIDIESAKRLGGEYFYANGANLLHFPGDTDLFEFYYPGSKFIGGYLELMRNKLRETFFEIDSGDNIAALSNLAEYYQTALRSQAVITVWNSVLMSQVNEIVEQVGLKRKPHEVHDYVALLLVDQNNFRKYFMNYFMSDVDPGSYLLPDAVESTSSGMDNFLSLLKKMSDNEIDSSEN